MSKIRSIGVIGAGGWLGGAIVRCLVSAGVTVPQDLTLSYRSQKPDVWPDATWTKDNRVLIERSDAVLVSVRPADFKSIDATAEGKLVVSVMAGVSLDELAGRMKTDRVIRSLPNAAAEVESSYTPWIASGGCDDNDRAFASTVFSACGVQDEIADENQLDYFAALTGTGPAYPALLAETLMKDAIANGVHPDVAQRAVTALMIGSAKLMERDQRSPSDIVKDFVDYAGMTAAAIVAMRDAPLSAVVHQGIQAALDRARSLQDPP